MDIKSDYIKYIMDLYNVSYSEAEKILEKAKV